MEATQAQQRTEIEKGNILQYIQLIAKLLLCFVALGLSRHLERFICFIQSKNNAQITRENSFLFILKFRCSWCKNFSLLLVSNIWKYHKTKNSDDKDYFSVNYNAIISRNVLVVHLPMQSLPLTVLKILSQDFLLCRLLGQMQPKMGDCLKVCQEVWQDCLQC